MARALFNDEVVRVREMQREILEKAMHRYRVSVLEDDPARVVFLRSASYDLHVACRKLDEFERGIK